MRTKQAWPAYPASLKEIFEDSDWDIPKLILSGVSYELNTPIKIFERIGDEIIVSPEIQIREGMAPLCDYLHTIEEGRTRCDKCDKDIVKTIFEKGASQKNVKHYKCHMGLTNWQGGIEVDGEVVAVCLAGQFLSKNDRERVLSNISEFPASDKEKEEMRSHLDECRLKDDEFIADFENKLEKELNKLSRISRHYYYQKRKENEDRLIRELRSIVFEAPAPENMSDLKNRLEKVLDILQDFFNCGYIAVFGSTQVENNVLELIASVGFSGSDTPNIHFNWRKAFPDGNPYSTIGKQEGIDKMQYRGLKGQDKVMFSTANIFLPYSYPEGYKGVFVMGPFKSTVKGLQEEVTFLERLPDAVGLRIIGLTALFNMKQKEIHYTHITALNAHAYFISLHKILGQVSLIGDRVEEIKEPACTNQIKSINKSLDTIEDIVSNTQKQSRLIFEKKRRIFDSKLDKSEITIIQSPLSVLLNNCIDKYVPLASDRKIRIVTDSSVDNLPEIEMDPILMELALSNILDNAVKYSHKYKTINVEGNHDFGKVFIRITNFGLGISDEEKGLIFKGGVRSQFENRIGGKIGAGLGLFQADEIIKLHNGRITCSSYSGQRDSSSTSGAGFKTTFTIYLPIKQ